MRLCDPAAAIPRGMPLAAQLLRPSTPLSSHDRFGSRPSPARLPARDGLRFPPALARLSAHEQICYCRCRFENGSAPGAGAAAAGRKRPSRGAAAGPGAPLPFLAPVVLLDPALTASDPIVRNRYMKRVHPRTWTLAAAVAAAAAAIATGGAQSASVVLEDYEEGNRIAAPDPTDPNHFLWRDYNGNGANFDIVTTEHHSGTHAFHIRTLSNETSGNAMPFFAPNNGSQWQLMSQWIQSGTWTNDTFNRMRLWIKVPPQITWEGVPHNNFYIGTYFTDVADIGTHEDGGGHPYHDFFVPYTGEWHQVIMDTHPSHFRGEPGDQDPGNQLHPTGQAGWNYFDLMNNWYIDFTTNPLNPTNAQADFYFDDITLYRQTGEDEDHTYSVTGVYVPATNRTFVSWAFNKNDTATYQVRYAFSDIHALGFSNAAVAPGGSSIPVYASGYHMAAYDTSSINVTGHPVLYIAIKSSLSSLFRQIAIPTGQSGTTTVRAPSPPSNVQVKS
jgi:hypothetical protein